VRIEDFEIVVDPIESSWDDGVVLRWWYCGVVILICLNVNV